MVGWISLTLFIGFALYFIKLMFDIIFVEGPQVLYATTLGFLALFFTLVWVFGTDILFILSTILIIGLLIRRYA
tara:strand:- start:353 stop:574 length:222 start_codon:yes stop_codon:yes gene_type:complete